MNQGSCQAHMRRKDGTRPEATCRPSRPRPPCAVAPDPEHSDGGNQLESLKRPTLRVHPPRSKPCSQAMDPWEERMLEETWIIGSRHAWHSEHQNAGRYSCARQHPSHLNVWIVGYGRVLFLRRRPKIVLVAFVSLETPFKRRHKKGGPFGFPKAHAGAASKIRHTHLAEHSRTLSLRSA